MHGRMPQPNMPDLVSDGEVEPPLPCGMLDQVQSLVYKYLPVLHDGDAMETGKSTCTEIYEIEAEPKELLQNLIHRHGLRCATRQDLSLKERPGSGVKAVIALQGDLLRTCGKRPVREGEQPQSGCVRGGGVGLLARGIGARDMNCSFNIQRQPTNASVIEPATLYW